MLSVHRLQDILETLLTDGIEGVCLVTIDGSIVSSAATGENSKSNLLAAIASTNYNSFSQGIDEIVLSKF
jgi:predicted regulator of Ras-like GTPase activity (Roadblock/LC7/MglB family)